MQGNEPVFEASVEGPVNALVSLVNQDRAGAKDMIFGTGKISCLNICSGENASLIRMVDGRERHDWAAPYGPDNSPPRLDHSKR